tara:strand:- start:575 stop:1453 length:879 start_codon:yes stop_codon:yes gene_type:complete
MTDIVSLSELRLLARQRADMENSQFISDDEWRRMLNRGYAELYDLIVTSANSEDYFLNSSTISLVSGTESYDLPEDFYKMRGVDINSGGTSTPLRRYNFSQRNVGSLYAIASDMRYHLQGSKIYFNPKPSTSDTITLWYIPSPKKFLQYTVTAITRGSSTMWTTGTHSLAVGDLLDGVNFVDADEGTTDYNVTQTVTAVGANTVTTDLNSAGLSDPSLFGEIESRHDFFSGWDEYIIVTAAISALLKEEADASALFAIKQQLQDRIIAVSEMRDLGEPTTVTDVNSYNSLVV